jgi:hypothetical protein
VPTVLYKLLGVPTVLYHTRATGNDLANVIYYNTSVCLPSTSLFGKVRKSIFVHFFIYSQFFPFVHLKGYPKVESTNLAFCNCRKKSQNARRGSCVIAPCIGGRAGRGRDVPVRPQKPHQRAPRRRRASAARGFRRCSTLRGPSTLARGETVRCAPARAPCAQGPGR